ncbi:hypothetical protein WJX72_010272 [[Myrmecia] bisecta]|uniref:Uncharacterized protein n=1 Tax=[Myrmecia] bisecta TaxID=41462 RepID=A0AAW1QSJ7_9CHLO
MNWLWPRLVGAAELLDNVKVNLRKRRNPEESGASLQGKVCLITGGNAGVGKATAEAFASRGARVILACRSLQRGAAAAQDVEAVQALPGCSKSGVEVQELDLASLDSVRSFAAHFNAAEPQLDVLVCNAGVMAPPKRLQTPDGMEMQFQVNHLAHWLLLTQLIQGQRARLRRQHTKLRPGSGSGPQGPQVGLRVLLLTSMTHLGGRLDFGDLQAIKSYNGFDRYAASKLANVLTVKELQRRLDRNPRPDGGRDVAVAVHPGLVDTTLARTWFRNGCPRFLAPLGLPILERLFPYCLIPTALAAQTVLFAATAPASQVAGAYVADCRVAKTSRTANDAKLAKRLWDPADPIVPHIA